MHVHVKAGNALRAAERDALDRLRRLDPEPGWLDPGTRGLVAQGLARVRCTLTGDDVYLTPAGRLLASQPRPAGHERPAPGHA